MMELFPSWVKSWIDNIVHNLYIQIKNIECSFEDSNISLFCDDLCFGSVNEKGEFQFIVDRNTFL